MASSHLLEARKEGVTAEGTTGPTVPPDIVERCLLLKEEETSVGDVGKHVRPNGERIVFPLCDEPLR